MSNLINDIIQDLLRDLRISARWDQLHHRVVDNSESFQQLANMTVTIGNDNGNGNGNDNGNGNGNGSESTQLMQVALMFSSPQQDNSILVPTWLYKVQERDLDNRSGSTQLQFALQILQMLASIRCESMPNKQMARQEILQQLYFCHKDLTSIVTKAVTILCETNLAQSAIRPLLNIVQFLARERSHAGVLTPYHGLLLQSCLASGHYTIATNTLRSIEILEIDQHRLAVSSYEYLSFFYFAGMSYVAVKDYEPALDAFVTCLTAPADALSTVMVQAAIKARLVSLIQLQAKLSLPKYTSQIVIRYVKQPNLVYDLIEKAFAKRDGAAILAAINDHSAQLQADQTQSLAMLCHAACSSHKIRELTNTYLTLSLNDIAEKVAGNGATGATDGIVLDVQATEQHVLHLIEKGEIYAKIDQKNSLALFSDGEEAGASSDKLLEDLEGFIAQTMHTSQALRSIKKDVLASREYTSKQAASSRGGGGMSTAAVWDQDEII